ncbi:MAG: hypothetical protein GX076_06540 [Clostridiales bacterium]|nr:hypothetical protein [Clostridiales bacterium]
MAKELQREWEGLIADMPEKYIKPGIPDDCTHVVIYTNGSRAYHKGLNPEPEQLKRLNWVISKCWDALPYETKIRINSGYENK